MLPPAPPKQKDDLRKKALSSILARSPSQADQGMNKAHSHDPIVDLEEEDLEEEESGDLFPLGGETDLQCPRRASKVPKLASWEEYWDQKLELRLPERSVRPLCAALSAC